MTEIRAVETAGRGVFQDQHRQRPATTPGAHLPPQRLDDDEPVVRRGDCAGCGCHTGFIPPGGRAGTR
ncbi:hypothetical protein AB0901_33475, partial [Streptomyces roseifaciens]